MRKRQKEAELPLCYVASFANQAKKALEDKKRILDEARIKRGGKIEK